MTDQERNKLQELIKLTQYVLEELKKLSRESVRVK
jgi:hypothetical protein